jgi:pilus assembly protein CpaB
MLASSEGKVRLAVVAGERGDTPAGDTDEPAGDGDQALAAAEEAEQKPFYFDDFFPEREKPAPAAAPKPSPGQRVQVFEGAESRSTYVQ